MAKCRSCNARVEWAITENGKTMPIDPAPDPKGNLIKTGTMIQGKPEVHVINSRDERMPDERRFVSHFATCVNADQHRRS